MKNSCINISIVGLGLATTEEIKIIFRINLHEKIGINWTNVTDKNLDCLLINEVFFDNENIQKIIREKKIPYLKISKNLDSKSQESDHYLYLPLTDNTALKRFINAHLIHKIHPANAESDIEEQPKNLLFFIDLYKQDSRKVHITDQFGTLAIIDHHAHFAWLEPSRQKIKSDQSIAYKNALTSDFIKVSRKRQLNLENWLFILIWNSEHLVQVPDPSLYYRIRYWPQPSHESRKVILQLSASFILGAEISEVSTRLNIPLDKVQRFVAANQAINNVEIISPKEMSFGVTKMNDAIHHEEVSLLTSFFGKLKRRFGF